MTELELRAVIREIEYKENGYPRAWAKRPIYLMTHGERLIWRRWSRMVKELAELIIPFHGGGTSQHHRKLKLGRPDLYEDIHMTEKYVGGMSEHRVGLRVSIGE